MQKKILISLFFCTILLQTLCGQEKAEREKYGNTLNLGAGIGYYGYVGQTVPVLMLNYEFDVTRNFSLAPFIGGYTYLNYYYWGNPNKPYGDPTYHEYYYRTTAIPLGIKGTYYFDELFKANAKWDFYAAASVGFIYRSVTWESGYYGDKHVYKTSTPLHLGAHAGAEYHMNKKAGLFLDISTGISTFGLAIHL